MSRVAAENEGKGGVFYGWIIAAASLLVITISYGAVYTFGVFLNPLREYFDASSAVISGAYALTIIMYSSCGMLAGWGVDKYGPRITTLIGGLLLIFGLLLITQVNAVWQLYLVYGLLGAGMSTAYTPTMTTISRWFVRRRGFVLGIISMGTGAGPLLTAPLASWLIAVRGWQSAYLVLACLSAFIIAASFLMKKSPEEIGELPDGRRYRTDVSELQQAAGRKAPQNGGLSLREAAGTKALRLLAGTVFLIGLGLQMVLAHTVAYSQGMGMSHLAASGVLSAISGAGVAGRIVMGMASDVLGRKRVLAICLCGEGIMIFWLIFASSPWMLFLFGAVFGFCYGGHVPQLPALTGETLGLAHMGALLGLVIFFWGIGGAIGPVFAGHVFDITGSYTGAFAAGGTAMLLAAGLTLLIERPF